MKKENITNEDPVTESAAKYFSELLICLTKEELLKKLEDKEELARFVEHYLNFCQSSLSSYLNVSAALCERNIELRECEKMCSQLIESGDARAGRLVEENKALKSEINKLRSKLNSTREELNELKIKHGECRDWVDWD
jgi:chromosome segregation ATPase